MSTIRNPVGPQPPSVYWRRRLVALLALVAVIVVIVLIVSAIVKLSFGDNANTPLRLIIAIAALAGIVVAVYVSKQRPVTIGDDTPSAPAAPATPPAQPASVGASVAAPTRTLPVTESDEAPIPEDRPEMTEE